MSKYLTIRGYSLPKLAFSFINIFILLYLIYSAFTFSSNYEQMSIRDIDDIAMQSSIRALQESFLNLDLAKIFFKFDYGYGWLFWFVYGLLSMPAFLLTKSGPSTEIFETLYIVSNRLVTVALTFATVLLLKKIVIKTSSGNLKEKSIKAEVIALCFLLLPAVGYWAGSVQPATFTGFLFLLCLTVLINEKGTSKGRELFGKVRFTNLDISAIVFGAMLGSKPTTILFAPLFIILGLICNVRLLQGSNLFRFQKIAKCTFLGIFAAAISASPSILIYPIRTIVTIWEAINFLSGKVSFQEPTTQQVLVNIKYGFIEPSMGSLSFLVLVAGLILLSFKTLTTMRTLRISFFILIGILIPVLYFAFRISTDSNLMAVYLFPLFCLLVLIASHIYEVLRNEYWPFKQIYSFFFILAIIFNFQSNLSTLDNQKLAINTYLVNSQDPQKKNEIDIQKRLTNSISRSVPVVILQSYRSPTLLSQIRSGVTTYYSFDNWNLFTGLKKVDYILINDSDFARLPRNEQKIQLLLQASRASELQEGADVVVTLFKQNKFGNQECKIAKYDKGNTLFICR